MSYLLALVAIGILVWRYRKLLGLDRRWNGIDQRAADDLAEQLGWRKPQASGEASGAAECRVRTAPRRDFVVPSIDASRLPTALAAGAFVAIVVAALDAQGYPFLASTVALAIGPFCGGLYVRSRWWVLVAPLIAVIGAGGKLGSWPAALVVAALAYGGTRPEVRSWLARWLDNR